MNMPTNNLEKPVERNPEQESVREKFNQGESAVDNPVCQPFCVVVLFLTLNCFDSEI